MSSIKQSNSVLQIPTEKERCLSRTPGRQMPFLQLEVAESVQKIAARDSFAEALYSTVNCQK
jgi:hypothetical protein